MLELDPDDLERTRASIDLWTRAHRPSSVTGDMTTQVNAHQQAFRRDYGRLDDQLEVEYSALVRLTDSLNFLDRSSWPAHRPMQFALVAYSLKTFQSVLDRLRTGFYEDAVTLLRVLYETFLRVAFVSCHRDDPWGALVRKPAPGTPDFQVTNFVRDVLRLDWETNYAIMSVFAHSNGLLVLEAIQRAADRQGQPERFGPSIELEPRLAELVAPFVQFVLLGNLRLLVRWRADLAASDSDPVVEAAHDSERLLTFGLDSHPKEYWRQVSRDLDYLMELVQVADVGGDWRALARSRPPVSVDRPG